MKKFLLMMLALSWVHLAYADDPAATIKLKLTGATQDNKYFLCIPNIGCLSVLAAEKGKTYPVYRPIHIGSIFISNMKNYLIETQGIPPSCNVDVNTNHTVTIYGKLVPGPTNTSHIANLHCQLD